MRGQRGKQTYRTHVVSLMAARRTRDSWALLGSGAFHAALALALWLRGPSQPLRPSAPPGATRIEIVPRPALPRLVPLQPATAPQASLPSFAVEPQPSPRAKAVPPSLRSVPEPARSSAAEQADSVAASKAPVVAAGSARSESTPPPAPATAEPPARIDLFPTATLCKTIGCEDGRTPHPGQALQAQLAAEQAEREGVEAVRSGRVDGLWRDIERDVEKSFAPAEKSVTSASRGELALRQLARNVKPAPEKTQAGWLLNMDTGRRIQNEIRAAQDAYDEAAVGREVEIEAEIDAQGEVVAVRIMHASGHAQFDAEALRAVRQALRLRPLHDPQGAVIARYALRGEVAVNLPRIGSAVEPNSGATHGHVLSIAGTFDEVTGKVEVRIPFLKRLKKTVRLLSVRKRPSSR